MRVARYRCDSRHSEVIQVLYLEPGFLGEWQHIAPEAAVGVTVDPVGLGESGDCRDVVKETKGVVRRTANECDCV